MTKLRIAGSFLIDGRQVKGEAREAFKQTIEVMKKKETQAINKAPIPKGYKTFVRDYFDKITPNK